MWSKGRFRRFASLPTRKNSRTSKEKQGSILSLLSTLILERIQSIMEGISQSRSSWWQRGVIYQIYPRSFADSNADGVGDLLGITSKLDYLAWLGIDAIWLSPIYPSPIADFGYDISDYSAIHPMFGTLQDFDTLLAEAHQRNIKVILDYV